MKKIMADEDEVFLLQSRYDDGTVGISVESQASMIDKIDMWDCYEVEFKLFRAREFGKIEELEIHRCWHNPSDPLYIKVTNKNGKLVFDGHGTDH